MANTKPTVGQFMSLRDDAIAKGVTREQMQNGGATLSRALDALKMGGRIRVLPAIEIPSWGSIVFVDDVPVQLDQDWNSAISGAVPDTPDNYTVRKVGHLYLPTGTGNVRINFVLVPLAGSSYRWALDWAAQYKLSHASPRHVFALAKHKPNIHQDLLKMDPAYVVSPLEQSFEGEARMCDVRFDGGRREARADCTRLVGGAGDWVAFLRE